MYLTRMPLNVARGETRRLVASPYRLHAAVEAAFPPAWTSPVTAAVSSGAWTDVPMNHRRFGSIS